MSWFPIDEQNERTNLYGASHSVVSPAVLRESATDIEDYYEDEVYAAVRADVPNGLRRWLPSYYVS